MNHTPSGTGRERRAFTLVELVVVVIIIAILAAIAVGGFVGWTGNSYDVRTREQLNTLAMQTDALAMGSDQNSAFTKDQFQQTLLKFPDVVTPGPSAAGVGWTLIDGDVAPTDPHQFSLAFDNGPSSTMSAASGIRAAVVTRSETGRMFTATLVTGAGGQVSIADIGASSTMTAQQVLTGGVASATPTPTASTAASTAAQASATSTATPTVASGPLLDQAVFSDSGIGVTNSFNLLAGTGGAANVNTNGAFSCNSSARVEGSVVALGAVGLTNGCTVTGDVRANGAITTSTNGVRVEGSLLSGADVNVANSGLYVGSQILARGTFTSLDGGKVITASGTSPRSGATDVATNLRTEMPKVTYDLSQWPGYTVTTWSQLVNDSAAADSAPSWSSARSSGTCDAVSSASYSLNGPLLTPATATLVNGLGCSSEQLNGVELKLRADAVIFTNEFTSTSGLKVSSADGRVHTLRIIVPFKSAAGSCASPAGTLKFDSGASIDANVPVLLYSAGTVRMTNTTSFSGQVYGCSVSADSATTIRYVKVALPNG